MTSQLRAVGYTRVSTDEQANSGAGLAAQTQAITSECARRGWELLEVCEDAGVSGKSMKRRPGLLSALRLVEAGEAGVLVVAKLDRLSRSLIDFATLMEQSRRQGWALVALDLGVDTSAPSGKLVANVMASVAEWERDVIGQRTREGLQAKRAQGVRLGRPRQLPEKLRSRIRAMREAGASYPRIANTLNAERVPTAHGGRRWYPATIRKVLTA